MKITDEELVRWLRSEAARREAEGEALKVEAATLREVLGRVTSS